MRYTGLSLALFFLAACATTKEGERADPVEDFVAVSAMPEVDAIVVDDLRTSKVINDRFVIVTTRREIYLIEYAHRCIDDPLRRVVRPDERRDARRIYAGADTYRGCLIRTLYTMTEAQADELRQIDDAEDE
jgi:hypothetical protein